MVAWRQVGNPQWPAADRPILAQTFEDSRARPRLTMLWPRM